jgi:hypothetical protein
VRVRDVQGRVGKEYCVVWQGKGRDFARNRKVEQTIRTSGEGMNVVIT